MSEEINEFTFEYFKYHYGCEWDTDEFLGWDEVWICIEQLYGHLQAENKRLREALEEIASSQEILTKIAKQSLQKGQ